MRLVQRREPYPLGYAAALAGSLATTLAVVLLATNRLDSALAVLAVTDWGFYLRVFAVVGIVAMSGVVSYRAGLWNIGQEGQAVVGALAALASADPLEALLAGFLVGLAWALPPALLRAFLGVNEAVTTFLLTFVAVYTARYFVEGPLRDPAKRGFVASIEAPHLGLAAAVGALAVVAIGVLVLYKTRLGLYLRLLASGEEVVRYAGASPTVYILLGLALSGALAGLGGAVEISSRETGRYMTLQQVSTGFGLYGISAAWLGGLSPLGALAASAYVAWLYQVGVNLKVLGLPALVASALVGSAMAWGLVGYVLYKYRVVWR